MIMNANCEICKRNMVVQDMGEGSHYVCNKQACVEEAFRLFGHDMNAGAKYCCPDCENPLLEEETIYYCPSCKERFDKRLVEKKC